MDTTLRKAMASPRLRRLFLVVVILALAAFGRWWGNYWAGRSEGERPPVVAAGAVEVSAVEEAFAERISGTMVEVAGRVERTLTDDNEGSRHQRFVVELATGHTVLVAHNIDLAPRVPLERGDRVTLLGQYEWNERGGVVHWTHHDPDGDRAGGWIRHAGREYR